MAVLVIGGANLDIKAKTLARHVAGTSNPAHIITKPGGVARNIAHNLARLGVETKLVAALGAGPEAELILRETAAARVDLRHIIRSHKTTGTYIAILDSDGELVTAINDMAIIDALTPSVITTLAAVIGVSDYVVADCNLKIETLNAIAHLAASKLVIEPVSIPKSQKLLALFENHKVFLATPNLDQLTALTGTRAIEAGAAHLHAMGLQNLVIHAGADGGFASDGKTLVRIPSQAEKIVDVTGAGDAATAGLVAGLMQGLALAKAAELGQKVAAKVIASESSTLP
jgi:pseudouridine kinase